MATKFGTAIVVVDQKRQGLWLSERLGEFGKGMYACPGGMIEDKEDIFDAAARELREETGLIRAPGDFKYLGLTANEGQKSDFTYWMMTKIKDGEKLEDKEPEKHKTWEYLTFDQALGKPLWLKTAQVVEQLKADASQQHQYDSLLEEIYNWFEKGPMDDWGKRVVLHERIGQLLGKPPTLYPSE